MMKLKRWSLLVLSLLSGVLFAGSMGGTSNSALNLTGYYIGLGGSYNWSRVKADSAATLNAISGLSPLGQFNGTTGDYKHIGDGFGLNAKAGYLRPFNIKNWLWGLELMYQYSQIKLTNQNAKNDAGSSINLIDPAINVTDLITMDRVQTKLSDLLILPVFIGHTYSKGFIYLGAGPALLKIKRTVSNISDTNSAYYIGNIIPPANTKWMWGGNVQAGLAYYLNPSWFLKLNYTYAITANYTLNNNLAYSSTNNGGLNNGTVFLNVSQRLSTQTATISINRLFS